ncbi:MAG: flagellar FlbD family protein, partial [Planctomycetota bacterium]
MIFLTRLNRRPVIVNAELIRTVESNPDTTITMINGDRLIVREDVPTVVSRAIEHARTIRSMIPEAREAAAVRASAAFPTVPGTAS